MSSTLRQQVWPMLRSLGIDAVFGNPGSTELPMLNGFPKDFTYYLGLQEAAVVMMADGYAQVTRKPVLVNLHSGPGLGNAVGSLQQALWSRAPLVVTAGQQVRDMITSENWLVNVDATTVPRPNVKWSFEPPRPQDVPAALARAVQTAMAPPRGPVFVSLPMDDWDMELGPGIVDDLSVRRLHGRSTLPAESVDEIVAALQAARNPVLVLGTAATKEPEDWRQAQLFAERAGLDVWAAPVTGFNVFDETSPWFKGFLPMAASVIGETLADHDLVLVIGAPVFTCYPYAPGRYIAPGARLLQITNDPSEAARAPIGDAFLADPGLAVAALAATVPDRGRATPAPRPAPPAPPTGANTANNFYAALAKVLPPDVRVAQEAPSSLTEFQKYVPMSQHGSFLTTISGGLGYGVCGGVGAAIADPSRPVLIIVGDGSLQYCITALWTAAQNKAPVVFVVLNNSEYAILKAFAAFNNQDDYIPGLNLPDLDPVDIARGYGVPSRRVTDPEEAANLAVQALQARTPALFELPIDPTVPPLV